jgi:AcrR family transcriptional regulator
MRKQQSEKTPEDRLFAAAMAEFAACGFAGARVDRIARSARVSKGLVYYYFHGKKKLYQKFLAHILSGLLGRMKSVNAHDVPASEKIIQMIFEYARFFLENPSYAITLVRNIADRGAYNDSECFRLATATAREIERVLTAGIDDGSFRRVRPSFVHFAFFHPILIWIATEPERATAAALHLTSENLDSGTFITNLQTAACSWLVRGESPSDTMTVQSPQQEIAK